MPGPRQHLHLAPALVPIGRVLEAAEADQAGAAPQHLRDLGVGVHDVPQILGTLGSEPQKQHQPDLLLSTVLHLYYYRSAC